MALSGWDENKKIRIAPGAGLVGSALTDVTLPIVLDGGDAAVAALFEELTPPGAIDDFTGTDGAAPSSELWEVNRDLWGDGAEQAAVALQGGALKIASQTAPADRGNASSLCTLSGNCAVAVDFDCSGYASTSNFAALYLWADLDDRAVLSWRQYSQYFGFNCAIDGVWGTEQTASVAASAGRLLAVRIGSTLYCYYAVDGGEMQLVGSMACTAKDVKVVLHANHADPTTDYTLFDNLAFAADSIIWPGEEPDGLTVDSRLNPLFVALGLNTKKIALEDGTKGRQLPVQLVTDDWDAGDMSAVLYATFAEFSPYGSWYLYYDAGHDENSNVSEVISPPAAPSGGDELEAWNLAIVGSLFVFLSTQPVRTLCEQLYSLRLLAMLDQYYGNMPVRRAQLVQLWGSARALRVRLEQKYSDSPRFRAAIEQLYALNDGLRALCDQEWSVASMPLRALLDQLYAGLDRDKLRAALEQLYVLMAGEAVVQRVDVSVTVDGEEIFSYHNINDEQDESLYYMSAELQLADQGEYLACRRLTSVVEIMVDGEISRYLVAEPRSVRTESGSAYVVPLVSETILLGHAESELAVAAEQNWSGMRKALVEELAAPFTVDWRLPNTFLPANILYTNGRNRIELIREIVRSLGGIVQTSPSGELVCRPEYPRPVNTWSDAEPDVELTDQDDFFQITGQPSSRPGYDRYFLSNNEVSGDDLRIEVEEISSREQLVQVTPVPWSDGVVLHHSGGAWVQVVVDGVVWLQVAEQVEFVKGAGRVSKPVHGQLSVSWRQRDLGEVTAAEDGELNSELADNSLAWIEYQTRAVQFRVLSDRNENVQVYPEVLQ